MTKEFNALQSNTYFCTNKKGVKFSKTIEYEVNDHSYVDLKSKLSHLSRSNYLENTTIVFIPESEKFPAFDYVITVFKENIINMFFKQTTISNVDDHYQKEKTTDISLLMKRVYIVDRNGHALKITSRNKIDYPEDNRFSLFELFVHGAIGDFGNDEIVVTETVKRRKYDVNSMVLSNGEFQSNIKIGDLEIEWYYIYESGATEKDQSVTKVQEQGILYRSREEIAAKMNVFFE